MQNNTQNITWPGWETVQLIGRGSFGAVYEIQRKVFDDVEKAALKVISIPQNDSDIEEMYSDGYDDESITSTFQNHLKSIVAEYSLMRKMNGSANIVNCEDIRYIQHDNGMGWDIFIKMELLTPLAKSLPASIPEETVIKIAKDMCAALMLCKQHGIVHRDIKPQNIFVSPYGEYKLGDFGIAKTVEKTMGGTKIGTYKYMAPEVYNNQPYGMGADIYSLGLVLYWLLNERRMPFLPLPPEKIKVGAEEEARNRRFAGEPLPPPAHGNDKLKQIVLKACAYEPTERYGSAEEMLRALNGEEAIMPPAAEKHTICFVDENDTVLSSTLYATGDTITPPVTAEKQINGDTYVFDAWAPALSATATQSATYRAIYKKKEAQPPKPSTAHNASYKKGVAVVAVLAMIICILGFVWGQKANLEQDSENTIKDSVLQKPTSENTTNSAKTSESQIKVDPCASGHKWIAATCTTAKKCSVCGETEGTAEGHRWSEATCTKPATCQKCNATAGKALGHKWLEATCATPKTCSVCQAIEGNTSEHAWIAATCLSPKICSVCNTTEGSALDHQWKDATYDAPKTCTLCGATSGTPLVAPIDPVSKEGFRKDFAMRVSAFNTDDIEISVVDIYADGEKIKANCEESVQLLYDLNLMVGDGKNLMPEASVTRAELAKIIYMLLNDGKTDGASVYANQKIFSDVASNEWYAGYINYAAAMDLWSGRADGTFGPMDPLTTPEAAKLMLCTMGYSAENCGYSGSNWLENVTAAAEELGLYDGFDIEHIHYSYIERQWLAVLIHNAIKNA